MFGYLKVARNWVGHDVYVNYRQHYCSLCFSLWNDYGLLSRFLLSYEVTFLSCLLNGNESEGGNGRKEACFSLKRKKRQKVGSTDYFSSISILLAYGKVLDDMNDQKTFSSFFFKHLLKPKYRKAVRRYPEMNDLLNRMYEQIDKMESEGASMFPLTSCFSEKMIEIVSLYRQLSEQETRILSFVFSWVYFIDAVDDLEDDRKHSLFNPLLSIASTKNQLINSEEYWDILDGLLSGIKKLDTETLDPTVKSILFNCMLRTTLIASGLGDKDGISPIRLFLSKKYGTSFL